MIERRLERLVCRWPASLAAEFRAYRYGRCGGAWVERQSPTSGVDGSYWLLFPVLLHDKHTGQDARSPGSLLGDALWAQYCVFLAVRTQDDLLDGQAGPHRVAGAVEPLHREARRALAQHFPRRSRLWPCFEQAVETTLRAIDEVDRLQQSGLGMPPDSLARYAEVAEIFKLGSAAVCLALGQQRDLDCVGRCCDHLAVASQIVDDLVDLGEDLERGRRSLAAGWLLRAGRQGRPAGRAPDSAVWESFVRSDAPCALLDRARSELRRASRAIAPVCLPAAETLIDLLLEEVDLVEEHLHRAKVELVFGRSRPG